MFFDDEWNQEEFDDSQPWDMAEKQAEQAFELYESGQANPALEAINQALAVNPANPAWHFNKALTLDSLERFDEAIEEYKLAAEMSGDDPEILNCLAMDYTRIGFYDKAIAIFEQIEKTKPDFEPAYCNRIIAYTEMGKHEQAEQMFYLAQQINDSCPLCFYNIGNSCFIRGEHERALWCWQKTAELDSEHPQINYRIAQAAWAAGDGETAYLYFLQELRNNPGDVDVIFDFGIFLLHNNELQSAAEKFNRILELDPDYTAALHYIGEISYRCGHYDRAKEIFSAAMSKDSQLPGPRFRLAQLALDKGRRQEAFELLTEELSVAPDDLHLLLSIGEMMAGMGKTDYAIHTFLRTTEIDAQNYSAYMNLADLLAGRGDYYDAIQFAEHALTLSCNENGVLKKTADIYLRSGELAKCGEMLKLLSTKKTHDFSTRILQVKVLCKQFCRELKFRLTALPLPSFIKKLMNSAK